LTGLALDDSTTAGDTSGLYPPGISREQWPFDEAGGGNPWGTIPGVWSDVTIFYSSLTPSQVAALYQAGIGPWISEAPDGAGNMVLTWAPGSVLQQASSVNGVYTDVAGSPVSPYSVPISKTGNVFYRARSN
jgi:hypothetical protein